MSFEVILHIVSGMGIFLYGISLMGDSLKGLAGNRLRVIVEKTTNKVWKGILIGIVLTALIQSSSGLTAILISLISAGLMTLPQAIPVIMGANIGTTITSILVGLDIKSYSLIFVAIGAIISFFIKKKNIHLTGLTILGFGLLFYGLLLMDKGLGVIAEMDFFENVMKALDNPVLGVLAGVVSTAVIQSSSALIAIVQQIYATILPDGSTAISLAAAIAVILGSNIGTTVTSVISAIGAPKSAKRAALAHVLFNLVGTFLFLILIAPFTRLIAYIEINIPYFQASKESTLALVHIIFNVVTTFILCWFVQLFVKIVEKVIPLTESEKMIHAIDKLSPALLDSAPTLALEGARQVIIDMSRIVTKMFSNASTYIKTNDVRLVDEINQLEDVVDNYDNKLHDYLVRISNNGLSDKTRKAQAICLDTIRDFERIADHCVNLGEFMQERYGENCVFKEETFKMIDHMLSLVTTMVDDSISCFSENDKKLARKVKSIEPQIDELEKKYRRQELVYLQQGDIMSDLHFVDILSNFERIGDHANNIADNILNNSIHDIPENLIKGDKNDH